MRRKNATILDIAQMAGVSTATVSRALSNPRLVTEVTRDAVMDAVRKTGFQINRTARNLRLNRTGSVLVLLPNIANPFFSEILSGLASVLAPSGLGLLVADTRTGPDPRQRLDDFLEGGMADGLVVLDGSLLSDARMEHPATPVVVACEWGEIDLPSVRVDNEGGAALAIRHLVAQGHRAIGHITGPDGNVLTDSRLAGARSELRRHGLTLRDDWVFPGDFSLSSGAEAARRWLRLEQRPTAVFSASDLMACGFVGELQHSGIQVPREASVVGFDDIEVAEHLSPALTTIRQPRRLIGERAASLLIGMIADPSGAHARELIPVELVERQSVAPPPEA